MTRIVWLESANAFVNYVREDTNDDIVVKVGKFQPNITAYEFLALYLARHILPRSHDGKEPTNSEIRRWLKQSAVSINNKKPTVEDKISFPITDLVFFPKASRKVTIV